MATFNLVNSFKEAMPEKVHNLGSDSLKLLLTNSAPVATNTVKGNLTEISAGNGYSAGGASVSTTSSSQSSGTYKLIIGAVVFTASGGSIGPFRYAALYNDTAASDELIGWIDIGSNVTLADGESYTFNFHSTNGVIQISG
jgi:hypothetical protein